MTEKPEYRPPDDDQLVNFAAALTWGPLAPDFVKDTIRHMFELSPQIKQAWLGQHREFQRRVNDFADSRAAFDEGEDHPSER